MQPPEKSVCDHRFSEAGLAAGSVGQLEETRCPCIQHGVFTGRNDDNPSQSANDSASLTAEFLYKENRGT